MAFAAEAAKLFDIITIVLVLLAASSRTWLYASNDVKQEGFELGVVASAWLEVGFGLDSFQTQLKVKDRSFNVTTTGHMMDELFPLLAWRPGSPPIRGYSWPFPSLGFQEHFKADECCQVRGLLSEVPLRYQQYQATVPSQLLTIIEMLQTPFRFRSALMTVGDFVNRWLLIGNIAQAFVILSPSSRASLASLYLRLAAVASYVIALIIYWQLAPTDMLISTDPLTELSYGTSFYLLTAAVVTAVLAAGYGVRCMRPLPSEVVPESKPQGVSVPKDIHEKSTAVHIRNP
eukprot:m.5113 g.5113  ORF g.5113 m.5113 type:complete len:289 (-) comp7429_c0_seq2:61-927(-)